MTDILARIKELKAYKNGAAGHRLLGMSEMLDAVEHDNNEMMQDEDCAGYKEHKTLTTNVIFQFPIEGEPLSPSMKKLKEFAMECYRNGWLEALNQSNRKLAKMREEINKWMI